MDHTANSLVSYKYDIGSERNHEGLSEQRYLQFGVVWREFGARDKTASCRKMDQFIFFEDIHEFVTQICRIWGVPVPDYGNNFIFVTYIKGSSSSWGTQLKKICHSWKEKVFPFHSPRAQISIHLRSAFMNS